MQLPITDFYLSKDEVKTTEDVFVGKRTVVFFTVGAFNPTCGKMLSAYEAAYDDLLDADIEQVFCCSVNDAAVMDAWASSRGVENVKLLPDGNGTFVAALKIMVTKYNCGMAGRAWRAAIVLNRDGDMVCSVVEEGMRQEATNNVYEATTPKKLLEQIKKNEELVEKKRKEELGEEDGATYVYSDHALSPSELEEQENIKIAKAIVVE